MSVIQNTIYKPIDGALKAIKVPIPDLRPNEVLIKITHSGLCASDHALMGFGMALGHEGVGIITAIGSAVSILTVGDRVGGGYHRGSCGHCKYCLTGNDIWCADRELYGFSGTDNGTIADYYIGKETYVYKIPEGMKSEDAAPLQCAGATTYSALVETIKPGDRVGVIGIGGLGHLAIQFANKLGAEVVVFSSSVDKALEAKKLGASEFCLLSNPESVSQPVDVMVIASSVSPDWGKILTNKVLARQGTIVPLILIMGDMTLPGLPMFLEGYKVHSSLVASRPVHTKMLQFAATHGIKPVIERFEMSETGLEEAMSQLKDGKMRYRGVLVAA